MVENQLLPLPPPHHSETFVHTVSFLIWQFTFKVWNVQCSVLFILTKKNVETAKSFEHITIKDKNQSSQLDWCKITVTIPNVCMYIVHSTHFMYFTSVQRKTNVNEYVFHFSIVGYFCDISAEVALEWNTKQFLCLKCEQSCSMQL